MSQRGGPRPFVPAPGRASEAPDAAPESTCDGVVARLNRVDGVPRERPSDGGPPATVLSETKIYVDRHQQALAAMITPADPRSGGEPLAKRHAVVIDGIVGALFAAGRCRLEHRRARSVGPLSFGAVGSYGRGRVALGSGVEVRVVFDGTGERADAISLAIATLEPVRTCGVSIEVQVTGLEELVDRARGDLEIALSVLDYRHVAGDASVSKRLDDAVSSALSGDCTRGLLVEALVAERHARHGRAARGGSFHLRDSEGALRDLDVLGWLARASASVRGLDGLVSLGVWTPQQHAAVEDARDLFWRVRNRLHLAAGKREDLLDDVRAQSLAEPLGRVDGEAVLAEIARAAAEVSAATSCLLDWSARASRGRLSRAPDSDGRASLDQ